MSFLHHDLGYRQSGDVVEITLSAGANVRLLDAANFSSYKSDQSYQFIGGLAKQSPLRLPIPGSGHWHVAVDMQGLRGSVRSAARVL